MSQKRIAKFKIQLLTITVLLLSQVLSGQFNDVSQLLGVNNVHSYNQVIDEMPLRVSAGVAVGDVNYDGFQDILYSLGDNQCLKLLINNSGEAFEDMTSHYNLDTLSFRSSSPHFFDLNNDKFIDFIVGSVDGTPPKVFLNINGEKFELQENSEFDILEGRNTITIQSMDYNNDGNEDLFFSHWLEEFKQDHFWENTGNGTFKSVDIDLGFYSVYDTIDYSHNAKFLDLNGDEFEDLLLNSDFGTSQIWINNKGEEFIYNPEYLLLDENGMGSTIGDFDNDGDFDWFVTSVFDDDGILEGNWGGSGNMFYKNVGSGNFTESSQELKTSDASWAWGTTFADMNNDGYQDIVVVNGWPQGSDQFKNDHLNLYISHQAEFFIESASELGIIDTLQGRGVSVFDYNKDGCLDIVTSNYRGPVKLYENICNPSNHYLSVSLWESDSNPFGEECLIELYAGGEIQQQKMSNSSNYVSQNPLEVHFGLKNISDVDTLKVHWTDKSTSIHFNIKADRNILISKPNTGHTIDQNQSSIYPNPARNSINVVIDKPLDLDYKLILYNSSGITRYLENDRTIYDQKTYIHNIKISDLTPGVYHISTEDRSFIPITFLKT